MEGFASQNKQLVWDLGDNREPVKSMGGSPPPPAFLMAAKIKNRPCVFRCQTIL